MSAAANLSQLLTTLGTKIGNCAVGMQIRALQESAVLFCEQSRAWIQVLTPISSVAGQLTYAIVNPWNADIVSIKRVGRRTAQQIADNADDEGYEIPFSQYRFDPHTQSIVFIYAPASSVVTNAFHIKAILVPRFECEEIAGWFLNMYRDGIIAGAASIICGNPIPTVYNEKKERDNRIIFNNFVVKATMDAKRNFTDAPMVRGKGYDLI